MEINFKSKLSIQRFQSTRELGELTDYKRMRQFESDRGRIVNSAAIRRLQQKTQVFPMERNAVVRTRLTHSLEVQQVGRFIVKEIFNELNQKNQLEKWGLDNCQNEIESLVEMSCLMHDVGNPPFGHFGEAAINQWFAMNLNAERFPVLADSHNSSLNELREKIVADLSHFEGNAQAIRQIHSLLNLNLTYAQIASVIKYTRPAYFVGKRPEEFSYLMKKPGYYLAEESFIESLYKKLKMQPYHRYPLSYIMEAADDISYCIADLEDSVEKSILTVDSLYAHLKNAWGKGSENDLFDLVVERAYSNYKKFAHYATAIDDFFMFLRINTVSKLVPHAVERFIENIDAIYQGSFNHALLEDRGAEFKLLDLFKTVALKQVFTHPSIEKMELQGFKIITGLFDFYSSLLTMPTKDFLEMVKDGRHKHYLIETRLFHKLAPKYCVAYQKAIKKLQLSADDFLLWEFYYRAKLIQDHISGMTDHFAHDQYRMLMVID